MLNDDTATQDLAREIAKNIVVPKIAPNELSFFDDLTTEAPGNNYDDELGFGIGELVVLVSPIAVAAISKVLRLIAEDFFKTAGKELGTLTVAKVKDLFSKKDPNTLSLTVDQVKTSVYETAIAKGLDEEKARMMADTVAGSLAPQT